MTEQEVFIAADNALLHVVNQIEDEQWAMPVPDDFPKYQEGRVTLREIINGHAYDNAWTPDMLAGKTMAEVGIDAFKGDLLGANPKAGFADIVNVACTAVRDVKKLDNIVHCSFGDFSASDYLKQVTSFHGLRSYDISLVLGLDTTMPKELVQGLWQELEPVADEWRTWGVFGPRIKIADDAPLQDRLLGLTGRKPL